MTNKNRREAFDLWSGQHGEEPIFPLQVWEAACQWQSQQAQVPPLLSSKDGEHWPRIGDKYLVKINGVLQEEIFEFDQGDDGFGGGEYFWARDDVDECPPFNPETDKWLPLSALLTSATAKAQVPEFDKKLFDSECRESVAEALGFQRGGDYAWSYLLAQIKEAVAAAAMLTASPAPGESAKSHNWNDVGERCLDCGDKDWFAGTVCEGKQEEAER